ncbi:MAG: twin-arginine translocase subunit TatC [Acidobacteriota bacterium]
MEKATQSQAQDAPTPWISLLDRLDRLRRGILWAVIATMAGTMASWAFSDRIFGLLAAPLTAALASQGKDPRLAFTRLTDPFIVYLSVALGAGIIIAMPVITAQLWRLIATRSGGRRLGGAVFFVVAASLLFLAGVVFGHLVLLPIVVGYLLGIAAHLNQVITAREYLRFALRLLLAMGVAAQLPLLCYTLARFGLVTARKLWRWFPYATLVIFLLAALITPPDGVSQVMVAVPMLILYALSIAIAALVG